MWPLRGNEVMSVGDLMNETVYVQLLSHVQLFMIMWTAVHQAPLSMEFSRE